MASQMKLAALTGVGCGVALMLKRWCDREHRNKKNEKASVVIVTDIGKDIDDTVALMYLAELHRKEVIVITGIIACGGRTTDRASVATTLLSSVLPGNDIPVFAGRNTKLNNDVFPNSETLTHPVTDSTAHRQSSSMKSIVHGSHVICLGPVTDIADIINSDTRPKSIIIQGQLTDDLRPDPAAYNLRCDLPAAELLFSSSVRLKVPVILLGKHAAYRCPITQDHITFITTNTRLPWNLRSVVLQTLQEFVNDPTSGEILKRAYDVEVDELLKDSAVPLSDRIWNRFPHLSVPYDPLCCMLLGVAVPDNYVLAAFAREFVTKSVGGNFTTVGNGPSDESVRNPERVVDLLCRTVTNGNWMDALCKQSPR